MVEQALRFGVCSKTDGLRAATWKLWTPSGKADVYLAARELKSALKLSLHESNVWRFAYDSKFFETKFPDDKKTSDDRLIHKWKRPNQLAPGITLALRIVTPWTALRPGVSGTEKIISVDPPKNGFVREIGVFLIEPPGIVTGWPGKNSMGTQPVGSYDQTNGNTIWVVHWECECPDFSSLKGAAHLFKGVSKSDISQNLRALVFGDHDDGSKVVYDLAGTYAPGT